MAIAIAIAGVRRTRAEQEAARRLAEQAEAVPFVRPLTDMAVNDPLGALSAVRRLRACLDDAEALAVSMARVKRYRWEEIAEATARSRSAAHRAYRHLDTLG